MLKSWKNTKFCPLRHASLRHDLEVKFGDFSFLFHFFSKCSLTKCNRRPNVTIRCKSNTFIIKSVNLKTYVCD